MRSRLVDRIEVGVDLPLTLLVAPGGFGKTTVVRHWLEATRHVTSRVDVRPTGGDPVALVDRLERSLQAADVLPGPIDGDAGRSVPARLGALADVIATADTPVVTVLEDVDVGGPDIVRTIRLLLDCLPATWRLVVTARNPPDLGVARLRSQLAITELGPADLALDVSEAGLLLHHGFGLAPDEASVQRLVDRFSGWPALVSLAAVAILEGQAGIEDVDTTLPWIDDFLTTEVLDALDPRFREFLLLTASLPAISHSLAEAVTGHPEAGEHMARLQAWSTVSRTQDDAGTWLHHEGPLSPWLRVALRRELPGDIEPIHRRAIAWYVSHGRPAEALQHACRNHLEDQVAGLVASHGHDLVERGDATAVLRATSDLSTRTIAHQPELGVVGAFAAFDLADRDTMTWFTEQVRDAGRPSSGARGSALRLAISMLDVLARLMDGRVTAAAALAPSLRRRVGPASTADIRHAGWDTRRAQSLADIVLLLAGTTRLPSPEQPADGPDQPDHALRALTACLTGDPTTARALAVRALATTGSARALMTLLPACLALAWAGSDDDARAAEELLLERRARGHWWLIDLVRLLLAVEVSRRDQHWRTAHRHLTNAALRLADIPDPGAVDPLLLAFQRARIQLPEATDTALTDREVQVLQALATTSSRRDIATTLFVSLNTIKTHLRSVYRKLGVETREDALARGRTLGVLD